MYSQDWMHGCTRQYFIRLHSHNELSATISFSGETYAGCTTNDNAAFQLRGGKRSLEGPKQCFTSAPEQCVEAPEQCVEATEHRE